jgi:hypothetical protein
MPPRYVAFLIAAAFTLLIYLAARWIRSGTLVRGDDDRPSASKAQWWVWTATAIFGDKIASRKAPPTGVRPHGQLEQTA